MNIDKLFNLPYLVREMLAFEKQTAFSLIAETRSTTETELEIRGATRQNQFTYKLTTLDDGSLKTDTFRITDIPLWITVKENGSDAQVNTNWLSLSLGSSGDILY